MPLPRPLTLVPAGDREPVDEDRANEMIQGWNVEIEQYYRDLRTALGLPPDAIIPPERRQPVAKISLSDKSYSAAAAAIIASWLTRGEVPIASGIVSADISDVIAGRHEDEALQVLQTLCDAFGASNLFEVDLSDNALGSKGVSACRAVLADQVQSLRTLIMCNNGLSAASMDEVADILTAGAEDGSDSGCAAENLTKIHFYNNMSGNGGCHAFARILNKCSDCLSDIRFSGTRAGRDGSKVVASALVTLGDLAGNIECLDLADNSMGVDGSRDLAQFLHRAKKLTYLNLHDCVCEDEGMRLICHALWECECPLEEINLSGNDLTKSSARPIADFLEENRTIKVLCAEENELTSVGVKKIVTALSGNEQLEEIRLNNNEIGRIGAAAIIDAYGPGGENMPGLKLIYLDENKFPQDSVEALRDIFGSKLVDMEDNQEDSDVDDCLSDDEDDEEEEDEDDVGHVSHADVDALTAQVAGATLDHDLT